MQSHQEMNSPEEKLYDLCMIDRLCRGNQEKVKQMVEVFVTQTPQSVEEIKKAYVNGDYAVIKSIAHRIKPTLSYYAIVKIEKDVLMIERLAKEGMANPELDFKIRKLDEVISSVVEKMKQDILHN